jgi:hypothetical protein
LGLAAGGGYFLPRRAFANESEYEALVTWAEQKLGGRQVETESHASRTIETPAEEKMVPERVQDLQRLGILLVAVGILGGMLAAGAIQTFVKRPSDWCVVTPLAVGHAIQVCGCALLAAARGFRLVHGLLGLVPILGVLFIVSRAYPEPGELINRKSWSGFLTTPIARQQDLSSWN